jgi:DNA-binding IclR family transcriptional regulator
VSGLPRLAFPEDVPAPATIVKPVDNAIRILRHLALTGVPSTVTLIARELRINPSTCFNILRTLVWNGMLEFDRNTKSYSIGLGAVDLANRALLKGGGGGVLAAMQPSLERFAHDYSVTVTVWRRIGEDRVMLVHIVDSATAVRIHLRLSQRLPLLIGAGGRVMAAFGNIEDAEIKQRFPALRWSRQIDLKTYLAQVETVREKGWAVDEGNHVAGLLSMAAPIFNAEHTLRGFLAATMLIGQHDKKTTQKITAEVVRLAQGFTHGGPDWREPVSAAASAARRRAGSSPR